MTTAYEAEAARETAIVREVERFMRLLFEHRSEPMPDYAHSTDSDLRITFDAVLLIATHGLEEAIRVVEGRPSK